MDNLDLLSYIQQARKSGMGDNKIREGLLQVGWPVASVEEAMMSKENPKSEVLNPKQGLKIQNSKTSIRNALFAILVLGISVTGYFAGAYYMSKFQSFPLWPFEVSVPAPTFTPRSTNLEAELPSDISSWKTYRNEEYGFEFKYPSNWRYEHCDIGDNYLLFNAECKSDKPSSRNSSLIITESEGFNTLINVHKNSTFFQLIKHEEIKIDNKSVDLFTMKLAESSENNTKSSLVGIFKVIIFTRNDFLFNITIKEADFDTFDQILSTFKFTEGSM